MTITEHKKTFLLLPGTSCTWEYGFDLPVKPLAQEYHVLCISYTGFDGGSAISDTQTAETKRIEKYVKQHFGGHEGRPGSPERLVKISRYQNYFPALPLNVQQDIYSRMTELIQEESAYCDKKNYEHMAQILTSVAMYEVLQMHGHSEESACRIVSETMWDFLDPSGMQKLARRSFFLPLMKRIVPLGFRMKSGYGWRYTMTRRTDSILNATSVFMPGSSESGGL